jgi:hypothetical protein
VSSPVDAPVAARNPVREGDQVRIDVVIEDLNHPAEIRDQITPEMARDWEILEESPDIEVSYNSTLEEVVLGEVRPEDVTGNNTVTKTYIAKAGYNIADQNGTSVVITDPAQYSVRSALALTSVDGRLARRYFTDSAAFTVIPGTSSDDPVN